MKLALICLLAALALGTDHVFKLGKDSDSGNDSSSDNKSADADAKPDPAASASAEDDAIKPVDAKVGDVLVFDLPADKQGSDKGTFEWVFLEGMMGRQGDTWQLVSENMKVNEDDTRTFSFGFKITKAGEDVISFVYGDVSKLDDAVDNFSKNKDHVFSVADMKGEQYAQVKIKAS